MTVWEEIKKRYRIAEKNEFSLKFDLTQVIEAILRTAIPTEDELKKLHEIYNGKYGNGAGHTLHTRIFFAVDHFFGTDFDEFYNIKISESDEYDLANIFGSNVGVNIAAFINDFDENIILEFGGEPHA